jgi:flagella basal body P-ring formation protein FlgA
MFSFDISPRRERNLGYVTWDLLISTPAGAKQKTSVTADVRAWQNVLVANRAIVTKQQFRDDDVLEKKLLLDYLVEDNALSKAQVVGQQASRDIATSTIITTRMVEATVLARVGQLVNVTIEQGQVKLKWVAEARESGCYGQTIRVRKPGTREEYHVTLTAAQEGRLTGGAPAADATAVR